MRVHTRASDTAAAAAAAAAPGKKGKQQQQQQGGLAIHGLAIRNHTHLRPEDFSPLFAFLRKDGTAGNGPPSCLPSSPDDDENDEDMPPASPFPMLARQPSLLGYIGLRYLDLAGNNLGDTMAGEAVRSLFYYSPSLVSLGLAGNNIKNAGVFVESVSELIRLRGGLGWLRTLLLDDNSLTPKALQKLFALLEEDTSLETLSLAQNAINDSKPLVEGLRRLLRRNRVLVDLNLSHTRLGVEGGSFCSGYWRIRR